MGEKPSGDGTGAGVTPGTDMMNGARCGKCGGWLFREMLAESRREVLWEWSCITCGQTYYPEDGVIQPMRKEIPGNIEIQGSAGKYSR